MDDLLELEDYELVTENVRVAERADTARQANAHQEQVGVEQQTPSGMTPDQVPQGL